MADILLSELILLSHKDYTSICLQIKELTNKLKKEKLSNTANSTQHTNRIKPRSEMMCCLAYKIKTCC